MSEYKIESIKGAKMGHPDLGVYKNGKLIRTFNTVSDDYAYQNAREFIEREKLFAEK